VANRSSIPNDAKILVYLDHFITTAISYANDASLLENNLVVKQNIAIAAPFRLLT